MEEKSHTHTHTPPKRRNSANNVTFIYQIFIAFCQISCIFRVIYGGRRTVLNEFKAQRTFVVRTGQEKESERGCAD